METNENDSPEEQTPEAGGRGGTIPPESQRWKPGQSGNPAGRRTAGSYLREELNSLAHAGLSEKEVREIARNPAEKVNRRAAAVRYLRMIESGDLPDFEPWLNGEKTLEQLRQEGVNTSLIKSARIGDKGARSLELRDSSLTEFTALTESTDGRPKITAELSGPGGSPFPAQEPVKFDYEAFQRAFEAFARGEGVIDPTADSAKPSEPT